MLIPEKEFVLSFSLLSVSPCLSHIMSLVPSGFPEVSWLVCLADSGSELGTGRGFAQSHPGSQRVLPRDANCGGRLAG